MHCWVWYAESMRNSKYIWTIQDENAENSIIIEKKELIQKLITINEQRNDMVLLL